MCELCEGSDREGVFDRRAEDCQEGIEGEPGQENGEEISEWSG